VSLTTAFTTALGLRHPIALAPMGDSAGGALAAAVSNGGGLGLVGGGRGNRGWLRRELALVAERTSGPWGIGFLAWAVDVETVAWALEYRPAAMMLSFGGPAPFAERVRASGAQLIVQVTNLDEARRALDVGADVIVAQGTEAGGHGAAGRGTLPFVPAVADLASPVPVLAAGGIADGRGLAAALVLGAAGALLGTRFQASREALVPAQLSKALLDGRGEDTVRNRTLDIARGAPWPERYSARTLRNDFLERWYRREAELGHTAQQEYRAAAERDDIDYVPVWAGEALDLITDVRPAADILADLVTGAERALASAGRG
jgi:nitronate monooxygenase